MSGNSEQKAGLAGFSKRVGRRNIAYVAFTVLLVPLGMLMEANGPQGPDAGGGVMFAIILWALGSLAFLVVNLVLFIRAMSRKQPAGKQLLAVALPILVVIGTLIVEDITMGG